MSHPTRLGPILHANAEVLELWTIRPGKGQRALEIDRPDAIGFRMHTGVIQIVIAMSTGTQSVRRRDKNIRLEILLQHRFGRPPIYDVH